MLCTPWAIPKSAAFEGKYFDVEVDPTMERSALELKMHHIGEDVLSNPVIEDFQLEVLGS